ncbi:MULTISPECIES: 30S ribosomal protein S8e [Halobacterium]|uniref:Small ribosomal subunit protein eS8 n=5 Tax=Halobacterium salinarum TaxID=2242 RepID=RS8E_HALSA|nr:MULTISPECIES: 30S ribosomal protein S8e [Halobacterium]B0R639.1 RecName: Full=Small ribosomal subunit protein eS8; AltName: Full=30S ribosomal protein S8e [Halobacterium salinarum R1]Q9HPE9.1 RecName: Full=Small ribosomal subunit protein eS8; AltName: Full=30S ribosomal protein S8e [Halobacterium salinarum NRC-1]AAG19920.1 30S ribosomal protein S8E [Halobacterium salinarum NRC-1]MBB6088925.1 small subunit ribosomal protein S8e [Halobacterium salinarum]MCF2164858.1 30S ribosomal protein S8e 
MQYQGRSKRSKTGARLRPRSKKSKSELGREPTETTVGEPRFRTVDVRGDAEKVRVLSTNVVNVATDSGAERATIEDVSANDANPNYARRNIITKGAIIETDAGTARVTSRPGQDGQVNATRVDE